MSDNANPITRLTGHLKIRHLELLLAIRQYGSLSEVSRQMQTTQSAVTHALADIEAMFGCKLFARSSRGMQPTGAGLAALRRAQWMMTDIVHLAHDVQAAAAGFSSHISIGIIPFVSAALLARALEHMHSRLGRAVTATIHEGTSDQLVNLLRHREIDCMIGRASAVTNVEGIRHVVLYHQAPRLIASAGLAERLGCGPLNWEELARLEWILGPKNTPMREQVSDLFVRAGLAPPAPIVESYSSKLIAELLVSRGNTLSIVPADIAEELVRMAKISIVNFELDWTLPPIALFTRAETHAREIESAFADAIQMAIKS